MRSAGRVLETYAMGFHVDNVRVVPTVIGQLELW